MIRSHCTSGIHFFPLPCPVKRQLPISPLASPVFKEKHGRSREEKIEVEKEEDSSHGVPEPLLLADLQSDVCEVSNTASSSSSSSYGDYLEGVATRPVHSLIGSSSWHPKQHSTMLQQPPRSILVQRSAAGIASASLTHGQNMSHTKGVPQFRSALVDSGVVNNMTSSHSILMSKPNPALPCQNATTAIPSLNLSRSSEGKIADDSISMMEVSIQACKGGHEFEDADSGILATSTTGQLCALNRNPQEQSRITPSSSSSSLEAAAAAAPKQIPPPPPPPPVVTTTTMTNPGSAKSAQHTTPLKWMASVDLHLHHTEQPLMENKIFTKNRQLALQNASILPSRLKIFPSSSSSSTPNQGEVTPLYHGATTVPDSTPTRHHGNKVRGRLFSDDLMKKKAYLKAKLKFGEL